MSDTEPLSVLLSLHLWAFYLFINTQVFCEFVWFWNSVASDCNVPKEHHTYFCEQTRLRQRMKYRYFRCHSPSSSNCISPLTFSSPAFGKNSSINTREYARIINSFSELHRSSLLSPILAIYLLLKTDSPYLVPTCFRAIGHRTNRAEFLMHYAVEIDTH